jgi:hypothetical protein
LLKSTTQGKIPALSFLDSRSKKPDLYQFANENIKCPSITELMFNE